MQGCGPVRAAGPCRGRPKVRQGACRRRGAARPCLAPDTGARAPPHCRAHKQVGKLSPGAQAIIGRYTSAAGALGPAASWAAALTGERPWGTPAKDDYAALLAESEYAAW